MRVLIVAAALTLWTFAASAQTTAADAAPNPPSACAELPAAPSLPDGASANNEAMTAGNATYLAWANPVQQSLACQRAEIEAAHRRWDALVAQYNANAQTLNAQRAAWDNEIEEYNARGGGGRQRSAGASSGH